MGLWNVSAPMPFWPFGEPMNALGRRNLGFQSKARLGGD